MEEVDPKWWLLESGLKPVMIIHDELRKYFVISRGYILENGWVFQGKYIILQGHSMLMDKLYM